jgi:hypothetical protein
MPKQYFHNYAAPEKEHQATAGEAFAVSQSFFIM